MSFDVKVIGEASESGRERWEDKKVTVLGLIHYRIGIYIERWGAGSVPLGQNQRETTKPTCDFRC
jgi:hypothetical protein